MPLFERVAVLGLGLLGGSVAWTARTRRVAGEVVGCGRRIEPLREAQARGLIDRHSVDPAEAVAGADLVILATPVGAMAGVVRAAAAALQPGAIVTDVGSVKALLAETLPGLLPPGVSFVGSHPMAGSHEKGVGHASPDLLVGATCVVTPSPGDPPEPVARVESFWAALGARVVRRDPATHDLEVAWISHVPHVVAFAFARALGEAPPQAGEVAGTGFRDFTRIAQSDPELWAEILVANRKAVAGPAARVAERLVGLARAIESGDAEEVDRWIAEARASLAVHDKRLISPDPTGSEGSAAEAQIRRSGHA